MSCKGQQGSPEERLPFQRPKDPKRSTKKALWIRFGEDILSATEEAISDLIKVVNPTLHDALLKSDSTSRSSAKDILNPLRDHKGNLPIDLIQTSIQTAVQTAVQSAVQEALRVRNSDLHKDKLNLVAEPENEVAPEAEPENEALVTSL